MSKLNLIFNTLIIGLALVPSQAVAGGHVELKQLPQRDVRCRGEEAKTHIRQEIQFIEDLLPKLRERVDKLQELLQKLRQQYNIISMEVQSQELAQQVIDIKSQLLEAQIQVAQQQKLVVNLREQLGQEPGEAIALSVLSEAPRYQELLNQILDLESKIRLESTRFKEASPEIQALLAKRNSLIPLLRQEAERVLGQDLENATVTPKTFPFQSSIRLHMTQQLIDAYNLFQIAQIRFKALQEADNFFTKQLKDFPIIVRQHTDVMRELEVADNVLKEALFDRERLRLDAARLSAGLDIACTPP